MLLLDRPPARLVLAMIVAIGLATQAARGPTVLLLALVVAGAGILQAAPWALRELGFEFNFGKARWGALMAAADDAEAHGDTALAIAKVEAALTDARRFPRPVLAAESADRLAELMLRAGRTGEAEQWLTEALRQRERVPGPNDRRTRDTRDRLADLRGSLGDRTGAEELLRAQVQSAELAEGADGAAKAAAEVRLADELAVQGRNTEAESAYGEVLERLERMHGPHHASLADGLIGLATVLRRSGRPAEAEQTLQRALGNADMAGKTSVTNRAREALLDLYLAAGRYNEAAPLSEKLLQAQDAWDTGRMQFIGLLERHADVLGRAGREEESGRYRRRAEILRATQEPATG